MTFAALKLFLTSLPWRWIGLAALIVGIWMHGYTFADNRADKRISAIKTEYANKVNEAQAQADARLAEQRFNADLASKQALESASEFAAILKAKQNELRKTTANLVNCRLSADTIRVLNDASRAATGSN